MGLKPSTLRYICKKYGLPVPRQFDLPTDYYNTATISPTAMVAKSISTLCLEDSDVKIIGESRRADCIKEFLDVNIQDILSVACESSLGTGDCIMKPYFLDGQLAIDLIDNSNFFVCESVGNKLISCILLCDTIYRENGDCFKRVEVQKLTKKVNPTTLEPISGVTVYTLAFRNGVECELGFVPEWSNLDAEYFIRGATSLLFGRIKSPAVNRANINSAKGVPVTAGLDGLVSDSIDAYNRYKNEFERKEAFVFADKSMFNENKKSGRAELPRGKDRLFIKFPESFSDDAGVSSKIYEYSPEIRESDFRQALELHLHMLEESAGLSAGILTSPTTNYATATEIKSSLHLTFAYMTRFRRFIEKGIRDLIYAINVLCDLNNISEPGDFDVSIDWSSTYVENLTEQYDRLTRALDLGLVTKSEVRSWLMDESIQVAENAISSIDEASTISKDLN